MPKIAYKTFKFKAETLSRIRTVNEIIAEYAGKGYRDLTLRQLYYVFVSRNLIANKDKEYNKLGDVVSDGRLAGLIDWDAIIDRTRFLRVQASWESPTDLIEACARQFRFDKWDRQPTYVECYIEKDALIGVIEGVCVANQVPYMACRGYASASEIWRAGHERIRPKVQAGKRVVVLYLGDHDPSGIDMTRDIEERLNMFIGHVPHKIEVKRLALNMDQVEEYAPPPNPAKLTDSRSGPYIDKFGDESWELDALDPLVIRDLIQAAIDEEKDQDLWDAAVEEENEAKGDLEKVADQWEDVTAYVRDNA